MPLGFGTGHSRGRDVPCVASSYDSLDGVNFSANVGGCFEACCSDTKGFVWSRGCPSIFFESFIRPSANSLVSAGQGTTWGSPTTRNETARVALNNEVVKPERGCNGDGILGSLKPRDSRAPQCSTASLYACEFCGKGDLMFGERYEYVSSRLTRKTLQTHT